MVRKQLSLLLTLPESNQLFLRFLIIHAKMVVLDAIPPQRNPKDYEIGHQRIHVRYVEFLNKQPNNDKAWNTTCDGQRFLKYGLLPISEKKLTSRTAGRWRQPPEFPSMPPCQ